MGASGSLEKKKNKVEEFLRDRGFQQEIKFFFFLPGRFRFYKESNGMS